MRLLFALVGYFALCFVCNKIDFKYIEKKMGNKTFFNVLFNDRTILKDIYRHHPPSIARFTFYGGISCAIYSDLKLDSIIRKISSKYFIGFKNEELKTFHNNLEENIFKIKCF